MRRSGRVPLFAALLITAASARADYGAPLEVQLWDTGRTPLAHMVDVTNSFGLKILAEHNFLNDNNIAFSPYGLTGIMIALFEGVSGESSYQLQTSMQLPWSRNVLRVGFRDIHRTLKTYFVPEEGFLAGLALNNENVTFNDNYKKVLRFYGFELEKEQLPTLPPTMPDNSTQGTTTGGMTTDSMTTLVTETPAREEATATPAPEQTTNPNAETIEVSPLTTAMPTENAAVEAATAASTVAPPTTTTEPATTQTTTPQAATTETTTNAPAVTEQEPTVNNEVETVAPTESVPTASETPELGDSTTGSQMEQMSTNEMETTTMANDSTLETLERKKKSIVDFIFTSPPYVDDYLVYRAYDVPPEAPKVNFFDENMFLANGLRNVQVNYMNFDTVLEHAFLPHLEASALRLPLDSERYYLLVVLPSRGGVAELGRLIARMARESDLRDVHAALRPRRVRAVVPSFTVKGHITLTTDLQKLGIRDVFEPRQRDFLPMTPLAGVYVRSVEQAVSVAIRKYRPDQSSRYSASQPPVHFSATYPFVYFVMDASIHVALMAGKMADPLNSRIL